MSDAEYENWVTMKEAQAHLGVRRETISKWIANHNLPTRWAGCGSSNSPRSTIGFVAAVHLKNRNNRQSSRLSQSRRNANA